MRNTFSGLVALVLGFSTLGNPMMDLPGANANDVGPGVRPSVEDVIKNPPYYLCRGFGGARNESIRPRASPLPPNPNTFSRSYSIPTYLSCFNEVCKTEYSQKHKSNPDYCQTPDETRKLKKGDCKDMAFLLFYRLKENKEKSRVVIGTIHTNNGIEYHAWLEYDYKGETLILDPAQLKIFKKDKFRKDNPHEYVEYNSMRKPIEDYINTYEKTKKGSLIVHKNESPPPPKPYPPLPTPSQH